MHIVHGYMYIDDVQGVDIEILPGEPIPLAPKVVKRNNAPAIFEPSGKLAPSNKRELDQFSDPEDFGPFFAGPEDPEFNDDSNWAPNQWVTVSPGRHYRWNNPSGTGTPSEWVVAPLAGFDGFDGTTNEGYFDGRWPQTKKELDTITITGENTAFTAGKFISLVGRDIGALYFWNGTKWVEGVAS